MSETTPTESTESTESRAALRTAMAMWNLLCLMAGTDA